MKKITIYILLLLPVFALAQPAQVVGKTIRATQVFQLGAKTVSSISTDSSGTSKSVSKLISERAAKLYADAVAASGGAVDSLTFDLVRNGNAKRDGTSDVSVIIKSAFDAGYQRITAPLGEYLFTSTVQLKNYCVIEGSGPGTIFKTTMDSAFFKASRSKGGSYSLVTGIRFVGDYTGAQSGSSTKQKQEGIYSDSCHGITIKNVYADNLGGFLFHSKKNSLPISDYVRRATDGNILYGNVIRGCFGFAHLDTLTEYANVSDNSASNCYYTIKKRIAANNTISDNLFAGNHFGFYSTESDGNVGHSPVTGNNFYHCNVPLFISNAVTGYFFSNNVFYTDTDSIYIENSNGVRFYGGVMTITGVGRKIIVKNCTNTSFTDVDELFNAVSEWQITGETPSFVINGDKTTKAFSFIDKASGRKFSIKNENGGVTFFGADSLIFSNVPRSSSNSDSILVKSSNGAVKSISQSSIGGSTDLSIVSYRTVTATATINNSDHYVFVGAGASDITLNIPAASSVTVGKKYIICRLDGTSTGAIQITPASGDIVGVDGVTWSYALMPYWYNNKTSMTIISDGSKWVYAGS
jgi:Periplasmic copper-binding protein (NosD)